MNGQYPSVREFCESIHLPYTRDDWQIRFHEKKLAVINLPLYLREILDKRARGESKTFDTMECPGLYLSHLGFKGIWFGAVKDQIEQPKKYMKWIIENSYLKYMVAELLKESVEFQNGGWLKLKNLTEMNARSSRADYIIYDEESKADRDAYNAAVNILAGSDLGLIIHISTPEKATVFEANYDRLRRREIMENEQFIFSRTWEDASWLRSKRDWYEEQKKIVPDWYFDQEHRAEFTLPLGAVFKNVIYTDIPSHVQFYDQSPLCSGVDWNPVAGHWLVGGRWLDNDTAFVIQHAINLGVGYTHQLENPNFPSTAKIYENIRKFFMHGNKLCIEDGGINIPYCDWLRGRRAEDTGLRNDYVTYEEWDAAGLNKTQAVMSLQPTRLYCDELLFVDLSKQIKDARWKKDAEKPELAKDPADSPHALDALLHAVSPTLKRDATIYREDW